MEVGNNSSVIDCDGSSERLSCLLSSSTSAVWDTVACLRMIVSCLSLLGAASIIGSVLRRKKLTHPRVHPIFSLALVDLSLAILWIIGGAMWMRGARDHQWCLAISLFTVILLCVSVNLTVVYAALSYSIIRKTDISGILANMESHSSSGWSQTKTLLIYSIAWLLPMVVVVLLFAILTGSTNIISDTDRCSCWCAPVLSNVMPYSFSRDKGTAHYVHNMRKLILVYGLIITIHFLVGFISLVTLYVKSLSWIRSLKKRNNASRTSFTYGTEASGQRWTIISKGESKARKRVFYFLTVFIISGFANFIFTFGVMIHEIVRLQMGESVESENDTSFETFYKLFAILQAVSLTQQGFLNAIVYGWTREDFLNIMAVSSNPYSTVHRLMQSYKRDNSSSSELGATWALQEHREEDDEEEKEEEEKEEEKERNLWTPIKNLFHHSHKVYTN